MRADPQGRETGRGIRKWLVVAASMLSMVHPAVAQTYPAKPVRIYVTIGPGAAADILARIIGDELSKRMGQPFIIENRAGAGGNIAGEAAARSAPDGYAFLLASSSTHGINPSIYSKMPFDPISDPKSSVGRVSSRRPVRR